MSTERRVSVGRFELATCVLALGLAAFAATGVVAAPDVAPPVAEEAIAIDEVSAGMRGYGLSVFTGETPERFEVEVLGVLRNSQPGESFILARLSGKNLEKTGVIAGMSGSPVYLDGRLAGAVAFSWPFAQEPIAGITPIATMRSIPRDGAGAPPNSAPRSTGGVAGPASVDAREPWRELLDPPPDRDPLSEAMDRFAAATASTGRNGLLWSASGFGESARLRLGDALPALAPLAGGTAPQTVAPTPEKLAQLLVPGGSVAAVYVDGDLRLAATGTITDRDGDGLLAFGHSVTGMGDVRVPLATVDVVTVFPSAYASFKLANSGAIVGAFERDNPAGASGRLGIEAPMIPVRLSLGGLRARDFSFRVAEMPPLVSSLIAIGIYGAWDSTSGFSSAKSVDLALRVDLAGRAPLQLAQSFDGPVAPNRALGYVMGVLDFLAREELGPTTVTGVDVALVPSPEPLAEQIVAVRPDRVQVAPGGELTVQIDLRRWDGTERRQTETLRLPAELPDGRYSLYVGDGVAIDATRLALAPAPPATLDQVIELVRSFRSTRDLAFLGVLPAGGLAVSGELLPRLPGSMRSLWNLAGVRGATPVRNAVVQHETRRSERPVAGLIRMDLEIRRALGGVR